MRALFNKDISTGRLQVSDYLTTIGPSSTFHVKNIVPDRPEPKCYILQPGTCTPEQYATVANGSAIIKDFFVVENTEDNVKGDLTSNVKQHVMGVKDWNHQ